MTACSQVPIIELTKLIKSVKLSIIPVQLTVLISLNHLQFANNLVIIAHN